MQPSSLVSKAAAVAFTCFTAISSATQVYNLADTFAGQTFFNNFDFFTVGRWEIEHWDFANNM